MNIEEKKMQERDFDFTFVFIGIALLVFFIIGSFQKPKEYELQGTTNIYSYEKVYGVQGSFGIFHGSIQTEAYYFYYIKDDRGWKLSNVRSSNTYLNVIEDNSKPRIEYWSNGNNGYYKMYLPSEYIILNLSDYYSEGILDGE